MDGRRILLLVLVLAMAIPAMALADVAGAPNVGWGLAPDHPLWKVELFVEWARTAAKRDPLEKAKFEMDIRERRLIDAQETLARGRPDAAAVALANYEEHGRSIEQGIASEQARPEFASVRVKLEEHKVRVTQRQGMIAGGIPSEVQIRLKESDKSIDRASEQAQAKAELAEKSVKEWLRQQERLYGMDGGVSLVAIYEGLTNTGKVPEGQLNHALRWYNAHYQVPPNFNGKVFSITLTKSGGRVDSNTVTGVKSIFWAGVSDGKIVYYPNGTPGGILAGQFVVQSENIQTYIGHMMRNDRLAMATDLKEIGAGQDIIRAIGVTG